METSREEGRKAHYRSQRKACIRGHEFTAENTYYRTNPNGEGSGTVRQCKKCHRDQVRKAYWRKKKDEASTLEMRREAWALIDQATAALKELGEMMGPRPPARGDDK